MAGVIEIGHRRLRAGPRRTTVQVRYRGPDGLVYPAPMTFQHWSMPGGAQDPGESLSTTAVRETIEETGITVCLVDVVGIFTDPRHVIHYTSNDEVRQEFSVVYRAEYVSGERTTSDETPRVEWVAVDDLDTLPMDRSQHDRIDWALSQSRTWIDPVAV